MVHFFGATLYIGESVRDEVLPERRRLVGAELSCERRPWRVGSVLRERLVSVGSKPSAGHHRLPFQRPVHRQLFDAHLPLHSQQVHVYAFRIQLPGSTDFSSLRRFSNSIHKVDLATYWNEL